MTLSLVVIEAEGESSAISVTGGWKEHLETFQERPAMDVLVHRLPWDRHPVGPDNSWCGQLACITAWFNYRTFSATEIVGVGNGIFSTEAVRVGRQPETRAAPGAFAATKRTVLVGTESLVARVGVASSNTSIAPRLVSLGLFEGVFSESRVADFVLGNSVSGVGRKAVFELAGARARVLPAGTNR